MTKRDFTAAVIAGLLIGGFAALIAKSLERESAFLYDLGLNGWRLASIVAACFGIVCLIIAIGSFIGRKVKTVYEAVKFLIVGGLNTLVDFGVLNILILIFSAASGTLYTIFKAVSFIVAVLNSYAWNKLWTFGSHEKTDAKKIIRFFTVSIIGFGINVIIASIIVNVLAPPAGSSETLWANVGAIVATVASMVWNFIGYKYFVFHRKEGTLFVHHSERKS